LRCHEVTTSLARPHPAVPDSPEGNGFAGLLVTAWVIACRQHHGEGPVQARGYDEGAVEYAHRSWPAEPAALAPIRREVERWLAGVNVAGDAWADLVLAVNEAASNVVDHAYRVSAGPAVIELSFWTEPGALVLEIADHGRWRPPGPHAAGRGLGIDLMRRLVESVLISHGGAGTRVLLRHPLPGRAPSWVASAPDADRDQTGPGCARCGLPDTSGAGRVGSAGTFA
jgi:serine/threonine-protein kinase RsbW